MKILELCREHGSTPREGEREKERETERERGREKERRVKSEHAWKASKAAREDLWEPRIFTLGTRLLCCLERLLPGDWSHPLGSLHPLSPPPLQTLVCDYFLSLPPILCMKSSATYTHALPHIQNNFEYINTKQHNGYACILKQYYLGEWDYRQELCNWKE